MDTDFISKLSEEQLTKITPAIFNTLQKIIQDQNQKLDHYANLSIKPGEHIDIEDVLVYLQSSQLTGAIIIEIEDQHGGHFYSVLPEDIEKLLGVPLKQCLHFVITKQVFFEPPNNADVWWISANLPNNDQTLSMLQKYYSLKIV